MRPLSSAKLHQHRAEARGAMEHQRIHKDPTPLPVQLALGEALWVALLRMGYQSMNAIKRQEGFRLHIISYRPDPKEDYAGERSIEISYYCPTAKSTDPYQEGQRMQSILEDVRGLTLPILGQDGIRRYVRTRNTSFMPAPAPLSSVTISCPPAKAIRAISRVALK